MKNVKISIKWTSNYDESQPNNNYSEQTETFIFEKDYTLKDYYHDHGIYNFIVIDDEYVFLDEEGNETGERCLIWNSEPTDEEVKD